MGRDVAGVPAEIIVEDQSGINMLKLIENAMNFTKGSSYCIISATQLENRLSETLAALESRMRERGKGLHNYSARGDEDFV